jgi:hypothetical protein
LTKRFGFVVSRAVIAVESDRHTTTPGGLGLTT